MEIDPHPDQISAFGGSSMLYARNDHSRRAINLEWRPEEDPDGEFILQVINLYEEFNHQTNKVELSGIWDDPFFEYTSRNRMEIVDEIERLMLQLGPYEDPRILKSPGVVDEVSEALRLQLIENEVSDELVTHIMETKNKVLQDLLIDHDNIRASDLERLIESGTTKGVRNKASQKLNSKSYKNRS
jgi:hypothetical protein